MAQAKVDNFTQEELRKIVEESTSMREVCRKLGYSCNGDSHKTIQKRLDKYNISTEHFTGLAKNKIVRSPENIFIENSTANQSVLRRWYERGNYSEYKCAICGLEPWWNGQKLVLTLDHINGNNHDDRLENLRWICPNCDRQLPTFAGKQSHTKITESHNVEKHNYCIDCGKKISANAIRCVDCYSKNKRSVTWPEKEELYNLLIKNNGNFTKVAARYGVTDNAVRKWCKKYNMPFHSSDYKK